MEGDFADTIVEADLELIKDTFSTKDVEADSKTLREPNGCCNVPLVNFQA